MLKAVRDLINVKEQFDKVDSPTGIIIPDTVDKNTLTKKGAETDQGTTRRGIVLSIGPDQKEYKVGQIVHFDAFAGILIYDRELKHTLVNLQNFEVVSVDNFVEGDKFDA